MIEVEKINILNIQLQEEDINNFISILDKLLIASSQPGFKKPFTNDERGTIELLAEAVGLDKPESNNIIVEKELTKE